MQSLLRKKFLHGLLVLLQVVVAIVIISKVWLFIDPPRLDRVWEEDQRVLADISIGERMVMVSHARDFDYRTTIDYTARYFNEVYDLNALERVWYIIEPFGTRDGPAHTMLSFDFAGGKYLSVSTEIRKEKGESFDAVKGLFRQYELVYMVGSERDLIRLRSNYRKDDVYMYPIKTTKEGLRELFVDVMKRAQKLSLEPEYYHTIFNTCTTAIQYHANNVMEERHIPWSKKILLPKASDEVVYELGLIDTNLSLEEARDYYKINDRAMKADQDLEFSKKIRPKIK